MSSKLYSVGYHMHVTLSTSAQASNNQFCIANTVHFVEIGGTSTSGSSVIHPSVVHAFCETVRASIETHPNTPSVVCPEDMSHSSMVNACLLSGAYLLLHELVQLDHILTIFSDTLIEIEQSIAQCTIAPDTDIVSCWKALDQAKGLEWLGVCDLKNELEPIFDVEMAAHYAQAANGNVHVLVPGKLLLFQTPHDLPSDQTCQWVDVCEPDQPTVRRFSAAFLAALLSELDVSAVVCLGRTCDADAAAFQARGLDVHDLGIDPRRPAVLRVMDRLLSIARAAPGAVAVFGGGCGGGEVAPEYVWSIAASWLTMDFGFDSAAAAAWVRMVRPCSEAEGAEVNCDARIE